MDSYYEFNDWIELYNNGSSDVSLNGVYLSDNIVSLDKWAFPDTSLCPYCYMIIWADDQTWQYGLHSNFKLSNTGEALYLTSGGVNIIDSVSFGNQIMDWSWGRHPNGTGPFGLMQATISAINNPFSSVETEGSEDNFLIYPNPANDHFTCRWTSDGVTEIELINSNGKTVLSREYNSFNGGEVRVCTSVLPRGMYFVRVVQNGEYFVNKIILQ